MNLIHGQTADAGGAQRAMQALPAEILDTLSGEPLSTMLVVDACDALSQAIGEPHLNLLVGQGITREKAEHYIYEAKRMMSRDYLMHRLRAELGETFGEERAYMPPFSGYPVCERLLPLGVLFHIAAGNMDALPFYSVIEGLLTGNINLLKLPGEEGGLSVMIFQELFRIQPLLARYVYVFDYSSQDAEALQELADMADAVVVWGGDAAVSAARNMARPDTRIIEWGHKLSFAYVTEAGSLDHDALVGVARNICETDQLLCSSCQGIYLDTDSMEDVYRFCERFLPVLQAYCDDHPNGAGIGIKAQVALQIRSEALESIETGSRQLRGCGCSLTALADFELKASTQFRNPWVKRLPRARILQEIRPHKNHLQTVGLLCGEGERETLCDLFFKTGVVRVTGGAHMSVMYCGGAHDGVYPLRQYMKIASIEGFGALGNDGREGDEGYEEDERREEDVGDVGND